MTKLGIAATQGRVTKRSFFLREGQAMMTGKRVGKEGDTKKKKKRKISFLMKQGDEEWWKCVVD